MFYTYVLQSLKDKKFYVGYTSNLRRRFEMHMAGEVFSTCPRRPLKLIFYEAYLNQNDALRRERYLKTEKGKKTLRVMLAEFLNA
jgi:putative endonuclease